MKNKLWATLAILLVVIILISAIIAVIMNKYSHEYLVWKEDYSAYSQRDNYDGFWALSRFLRKYQSKPVIYIENKKQFDKYISSKKTNDVMFLTSHSEINSSTTNLLMNWIGQGNHLVVEGKHEQLLKHWNINYPVKSKNKEDIFGIKSACTNEYEKIRKFGLNKYSLDEALKICTKNASVFRLPENENVYIIDSINLEGFFDIDSSKNVIATAKNSSGYTLVHAKHNDGTITFVRSTDLFAHPKKPNDFSKTHINRLDNTYLAAYLSHNKSNIYIATPTINTSYEKNIPLQPPLWWQIFRKQPLVWTTFLLLIIAIIWHKARRLGAIRNYDDRAERTIATHCLAQGRLIDKYKEQRSVLLEWQAKIQNEWHKKTDKVQISGQNAIVNYISQITKLSRDDVRLWLNPIPEKLNQSDLLRYIQSHQRIRTQRK